MRTIKGFAIRKAVSVLSLSYYSIHTETWFGLIRSTLLSTIFVYRLVLRGLTTSVGCFFLTT